MGNVILSFCAVGRDPLPPTIRIAPDAQTAMTGRWEKANMINHKMPHMSSMLYWSPSCLYFGSKPQPIGWAKERSLTTTRTISADESARYNSKADIKKLVQCKR